MDGSSNLLPGQWLVIVTPQGDRFVLAGDPISAKSAYSSAKMAALDSSAPRRRSTSARV